jgi:hypothetical protein
LGEGGERRRRGPGELGGRKRCNGEEKREGKKGGKKKRRKRGRLSLDSISQTHPTGTWRASSSPSASAAPRACPCCRRGEGSRPGSGARPGAPGGGCPPRRRLPSGTSPWSRGKKVREEGVEGGVSGLELRDRCSNGNLKTFHLLLTCASRSTPCSALPPRRRTSLCRLPEGEKAGERESGGGEGRESCCCCSSSSSPALTSKRPSSSSSPAAAAAAGGRLLLLLRKAVSPWRGQREACCFLLDGCLLRSLFPSLSTLHRKRKDE